MACVIDGKPWRAAAWLVLTTLLMMFVAPRSALAETEGPRIAVQPVVVEGELPRHLLRDVETRLRANLGTDVFAVDTTCEGEECWVALASDTRASHVVRLSISVRQRDYGVRAELIDGDYGEVVANVERTCDVCGAAELATTIEDVADALRRKLASDEPRPAVLVVTSTPAGASVTMDGTLQGTTPLTIEVLPGTHDIAVEKSEHIAQRRRLVFVDGVQQAWKVDLVATSIDDDRARRPMRAVGWTAIGVGLAGVGGGVGLALLDEGPITSRCSGDNVDDEGNCKYRYDTLVGGVATAVVGAVVLGTGIALVVVDRKRHGARRVAVMPTLRGIAFSGRF